MRSAGTTGLLQWVTKGWVCWWALAMLAGCGTEAVGPACDDKVCDDGNPCTTDGCQQGKCAYSPATDGKTCEDGLGCTSGDTCKAGKCSGQHGCDDGEPCTDDACAADGCKHTPNQGKCDDGDACTAGDQCEAAACKPGVQRSCDDGKVCTDDSCDAAKGCQNVARGDGAVCDDGDACTAVGACQAGECKAGTANPCDDGKSCTADTCDPATGCSHAPKPGAECDDGNVCTNGDSCDGAVCLPGLATSCDDGDECTSDGCHPLTGCSHLPVDSEPCDDGNACTNNETCAAGKCQGGVPKVCLDENPCTEEGCDPFTGCAHQPLNSGPCSDDDACTKDDACQAGQCVGAKIACDDGNPCTIDLCGAAFGCAFQPLATPCDDGNACTIEDVCTVGACVGGKPLPCSDGNPCTADVCDAKTGCSFTDLTVPCTDGSACTQGDTCQGGACKGKAIACDDGNSCTADACDDTSGCTFLPVQKVCDANGCTEVPVTSPCDDGNACTLADACQGGKCQAKAANCDDKQMCTIDFCDPAKGCQHVPMPGKTCTDGNLCTNSDICQPDGTCQGVGTTCDDSDPCTTDTCDKNGCKNTPLPAGSCDDGNVCTDDACKSGSGCTHVANLAPCQDSDPCTQSESCLGGKCTSKPVTCNDNNPCTKDACVTYLFLGCVYSPQTGSCDDGDPCTFGDNCQGGGCKATAKNCDDGNSCTADSCSAGTCLHKPVAEWTPCYGGQGQVCNAAGSCGPSLFAYQMAWIEAADFLMGCTPQDPNCQASEKPQHAVAVKSFFLDLYEVTVGQYKACVAAGACTATPKEAPNGYCTQWLGKDKLPINCATWTQADAYCKWKGKRLPTEAEWERAAREGNLKTTKIYPWGDSAPDCSDAWFKTMPGKAACAGTLPTEVGTKTISDALLFDLVGNVAEWVQDGWDPTFYAKSPVSDPVAPVTAAERVLRNGSFGSYPFELRTSARVGFKQASWHAGTGFRCARNDN